MKKSILALSIIASLSACELDNSDAKKVPAGFNNEFETEVSFYGTDGEGFDIELTTGHGYAEGTFGVTDVNYGEANVNYNLVGTSTDPEKADAKTRTLTTTYGVFTIEYSAEGYSTWTYDLNEAHDEVNELIKNPLVSEGSEELKAPLTDTVTLTTLDGSTQTLNFTIKAVAPAEPAEFKGALLANVAKAGDASVAYGRAQVYDPNFDQSSFKPAVYAPIEGEEDPTLPKYGTLTIEADGKWEYVLNKKHEGIAHLIEDDEGNSPEPVIDTLKIYSADGTEQDFKVIITAAPKNFAASVPVSAEEKSVLRIDFLEPMKEVDTYSGKLTFKAKVTEDLAKEANIGIGCARWHADSDVKRRLTTLYTKANGEFSMWSAPVVPGGSYRNGAADYAYDAANKIITEKAVFDQMLTPGEWSTIELTWDTGRVTKKDTGFNRPKMTLTIDGTQVTSDHGAIPINPNEKFLAQTLAGDSIYGCLSQLRVEINKSDAETTGAFLIDDIKYFSNIDADVKFDVPDYEELFTNYEAGTQMNASENDKRYQDITTDNVLVVESEL